MLVFLINQNPPLLRLYHHMKTGREGQGWLINVGVVGAMNGLFTVIRNTEPDITQYYCLSSLAEEQDVLVTDRV